MSVDTDRAFVEAARPHWHPVARTADLGPGVVLAVTLLDEQLALWRAPDGAVGLVDDLCVHRGTRLSAGSVTADGCIRCPYHSWTFDGTGACRSIPQMPDGPIPARARVPAARVIERAGLVWACLVGSDAEARPLPELPEFARDGWHVYAGEPMDWACQSARQVENFLDIAHFSVVHVDVFGNPDVMEVPPHVVERSDDGWNITTTLAYPGLNPMLPPDENGKPIAAVIDFAYRVELPFTVRLSSSMMDQPYVLLSANQPVSADTCRVFWVMSAPDEMAMPDEVVEVAEQAVFHPDRRVVETQRPERLPLDLTAELHLPFDKLAVAYRRALADLGFPSSVTGPVLELR
jgi:vanillate O-demethylase monooxygenase subunit